MLYLGSIMLHWDYWWTHIIYFSGKILVRQIHFLFHCLLPAWVSGKLTISLKNKFLDLCIHLSVYVSFYLCISICNCIIYHVSHSCIHTHSFTFCLNNFTECDYSTLQIMHSFGFRFQFFHILNITKCFTEYFLHYM